MKKSKTDQTQNVITFTSLADEEPANTQPRKREKNRNQHGVYGVITERIIGLLHSGVVPWRKPWSTDLPKSLVSAKEYRGINSLLLNCAGYSSPWFLTYRQAAERGGAVRSGERGWPVIFWKWLEREGADGEVEQIPLLRYYTVFNVAQCDGIQAPEPEGRIDFEPIAACEEIVRNYPNAPIIEHREQRAYYHPKRDLVNLPERTRFESPEKYYGVAFHELVHSTGHEKRLNRKSLTDLSGFGSHEYSKEELVAEMGAAFLCAVAGVEPSTIENSAAYIKGWLERLRDDHTLVVQAAAQAQKAADHIQGKTYEKRESEPTALVA